MVYNDTIFKCTVKCMKTEQTHYGKPEGPADIKAGGLFHNSSSRLWMTLPRSECIPNCDIHNKKNTESKNNIADKTTAWTNKRTREEPENQKKTIKQVDVATVDKLHLQAQKKQAFERIWTITWLL